MPDTWYHDDETGAGWYQDDETGFAPGAPATNQTPAEPKPADAPSPKDQLASVRWPWVTVYEADFAYDTLFVGSEYQLVLESTSGWKRTYELDIQESKGSQGATIKKKPDKPTEGTFTIAWAAVGDDDSGWQTVQACLAYMRACMSTDPLTAIQVYCPATSLAGVESVVLKDIGEFTFGPIGRVTLSCVEYMKSEPKKTGTGTGAGTGPTSGKEDDPEWGSVPSPENPLAKEQEEADAELAKEAKEAGL